MDEHKVKPIEELECPNILTEISELVKEEGKKPSE
jgi:hypothetical protein